MNGISANTSVDFNGFMNGLQTRQPQTAKFSNEFGKPSLLDTASAKVKHAFNQLLGNENPCSGSTAKSQGFSMPSWMSPPAGPGDLSTPCGVTYINPQARH